MAMFKVVDKGHRRDTCRSCGAPVTWFTMAKSGKAMPFNGEPVYVRTETDGDGRMIGIIDGSLSPSHFATCPQGDNWRRR